MTFDRTPWQNAETPETGVARSVSDEYWRSGTVVTPDGLDFLAPLAGLPWGLDDGGRDLLAVACGLEEDGSALLDAGCVLFCPPTCPGAYNHQQSPTPTSLKCTVLTGQ